MFIFETQASGYMYIAPNGICEQIASKRLGTGNLGTWNWVQAIQSHHGLMSTYIAQSAGTHERSLPNSVSQVVSAGFETPVIRTR